MKSKLFRFLINLIAKTWRINHKGILPNDRCLVAFWHGKMLPVWYFFKNNYPYAVVSKSKDGQILSDLLEKWNYKLIRGSSSKEGKQVLENILNAVEENIVLITPDGPRGPKQVFKAGVFVASQKKQKPFYFIEVNIKNSYVFKKAWDKFEFPLPFSKIDLISYGPFLIGKKLDKKELNQYINEFKYK